MTRHRCNLDVWALAKSRGVGHRSLVTPKRVKIFRKLWCVLYVQESLFLNFVRNRCLLWIALRLSEKG